MLNARQIAATFWVAVAMLLGLAAFFAVVGGARGTAFSLVVLGLALAFAVHQLLRSRQRDEIGLSPDARYSRERRGF